VHRLQMLFNAVDAKKECVGDKLRDIFLVTQLFDEVAQFDE
jgi:hypothetical protein